MSTERVPFSTEQDLLVDFVPSQGLPEYVAGYVKRSYKIVADRLVRDEVRPLVVAPQGPDRIDPRQTGVDTLGDKPVADLTIYGSVLAPNARPTERMTARVVHGRIEKRLAVIGDRVAMRSGTGAVTFSEPAPFTEMPLDWQRSYGGVDDEVPITNEHMLALAAGVPLDHPGVYPRNPAGRGYYVVDCAREEPMPLPNFEDPEDLLSAEAFWTRNASAWWQRPLPWNFAPTYFRMFPRSRLLGLDPWYPAPLDSQLPEISRRFFEPSWPEHESGIALRFAQQEAPLGLWVFEPKPGMPVELHGMSLDGQARRFALPEAPLMRFELDGQRHEELGRLLSIEVHPNEDRVHMTWCARHVRMHRRFIPGVFKNIPLSMLVDGDVRVRYETPPVITANG